MSESPIFVKSYELIRWLVPKTTGYPRQHRFSLALPMQQDAFNLQRHLIQAAKAKRNSEIAGFLNQADVELAMLRYKIRLCRELNLLQLGSYEHASRMVDEIGRLLGGWQKKIGISGASAP